MAGIQKFDNSLLVDRFDHFWNDQITPEQANPQEETGQNEVIGTENDTPGMAMENIFETDLNHNANTIIYWYRAKKKLLDKI